MASGYNAKFVVFYWQAFIKLESLESIPQEKRDAYEELAIEVFTK
jgi:hypothetical protein